MRSMIASIFVFHAIVYGIISLTKAQALGPTQQVAKCRDTGNFKNEKLQQFRDGILEDIGNYKMTVGDAGYITARIYQDFGNGINGIQAMALCPPNVKVESCKDCILKTIPYLKQNCPNKKEGMAWISLPRLNCMTRYAVGFFEGKLSDWAWAEFSNNQTVQNARDLVEALRKLMNQMKWEAASGDGKKKYGSGFYNYGPQTNVYGAMQCTPDLSKEDCAKCLSVAVDKIISCCAGKGKFSARTLTTSCYARYSHEVFLREE